VKKGELFNVLRVLREAKTLRELIVSLYALLGPQAMMVYHHDSPGMRVYVRRNILQRAMLRRSFSSVHEKHIPFHECFPKLKGRALQRALEQLRRDFDEWLVFEEQLEERKKR